MSARGKIQPTLEIAVGAKNRAGRPAVLADPMGRKWYDMIQTGKGAQAAIEIITSFSQGTYPKALMYLPGTPPYRSAWRETIKAAEEANDPGLALHQPEVGGK